ncbi:MAG: dephospho-CoA kinase [Spirochaetes bacterium]|nr:MAG: dephospho-CoA kinase [Spirochaetota bacterium]
MKIGVTGIFASGKGTVCKMFEELGARVIDTDELARDVVAPGTEGLETLVREFGTGILGPDGALDRRRFGVLIFKDKVKVNRVNQITHPLILKRAAEAFEKNPGAVFMINTPLLFESGFDKFMDATIVVTAGTEQAVERGVKRDNISAEEIRDRLNNQISLNEKIRRADHVIDNSGTLENTKKQVIKIWNALTISTKKE